MNMAKQKHSQQAGSLSESRLCQEDLGRVGVGSCTHVWLAVFACRANANAHSPLPDAPADSSVGFKTAIRIATQIRKSGFASRRHLVHDTTSTVCVSGE